MDAFTYDPLNHEKHEVRLLEIIPSILNGPIRCRLIHYSLEKALSYEAISYAWGDDKASFEVELNGRSFLVRKNLHDALRRFRGRFKSRKLWADAICINQADQVERGEQIQLMRQIYCRASAVLIWLGLADGRSNWAIKYLKSLSGYNVRKANPYRDIGVVGEVPRLLSRSWFERVWVIQEVAVARQATLFCGNQDISWHSLVKAVNVFSCFDQFAAFGQRIAGTDTIMAAVARLPDLERNINNFEAFRKLQDRLNSSGPNFSQLEDVFEHMRGRKATDPRDRIYAALALLPFEQSQSLKPDYTIIDYKVYRNIVLAALLKGSLKFLRYCQPHLQTQLPSWMPDWSKPRLTPMLQDGVFMSYYDPYNASGNSSADYHCVQDGSEIRFLTATGKLVDIVDDVTGDYDQQRARWEDAALTCSREILQVDELEAEFFRSEPLPMAEEYQRVAEKIGMFDQSYTLLIGTGSSSHESDFYDQKSPLGPVIRENEMKHSKYRTGDCIWDVYIMTLIADRSQDTNCRKTRDFLNILKICRLAKRWTYTDLAWSTALTKRIPESVSRKAILTSETRYPGLGPEFARTGDFIVILKGMEVPLILRKIENESCYTVLGEACKISRPLEGQGSYSCPLIQLFMELWTANSSWMRLLSFKILNSVEISGKASGCNPS